MSIVEPGMESMLEVFVHETETMLNQLDEILLVSEKAKNISDENVNSIFRITHTIKGSAAMMDFEGMSNLAHSIEDVFYILRESPEKLEIIFDTIFDLVFQSSDFLKKELEKLECEEYIADDPSELIDKLEQQVAILNGNESAKESLKDVNVIQQASIDPDEKSILVFFEDGCQMENIRSVMLVSQLNGCCDYVKTMPENLETNANATAEIEKNGLMLYLKPSDSFDEVIKTIESSLSIKSYEVIDSKEKEEKTDAIIAENADVSVKSDEKVINKNQQLNKIISKENSKQSLLSVNQVKLDKLMDLVGELVTAQSMVARNPDIKGLKLDNFNKSIRELGKLTNELQDIVMSIRMVPLQGTFHKMDRLVRDMSKKLNKKVDFVTIGGETEVDKTINDAIVDPLMHMIRNSLDHAIETPEERLALGKSEIGSITLYARNAGGEILIDVTDDGSGLDSQKLLKKAKENGILTKPEEAYSEKEAFNLIMMAGFSTNTVVTEYSGRGVGMDVVRKNIEQVGGSVSIKSVKNQGTTFTIKIPLTIAIVDGMNISVGNTVFTLPITSIKQLFKITDSSQIIHNTNGAEMILIRGECFPVYRLHKLFDIPSQNDSLTEGLLIQIESGTSSACILADKLLGEHQVVVKPFPTLLNQYNLKERGLSGCSILGDGSISLIIDAGALINNK